MNGRHLRHAAKIILGDIVTVRANRLMARQLAFCALAKCLAVFIDNRSDNPFAFVEIGNHRISADVDFTILDSVFCLHKGYCQGINPLRPKLPEFFCRQVPSLGVVKKGLVSFFGWSLFSVCLWGVLRFRGQGERH